MSHSKKIDSYRRKLARKMIFNVMSLKAVSDIRIYDGNRGIRLSSDFLKSDRLVKLRRLNIHITAIHIFIASLFFFFNLTTADPLSQIGSIILTVALLIIIFGVGLHIYESVIRDEDIIVYQKQSATT